MGLHLNYELRLPHTASPAAVDAILARLAAKAASLPFEFVNSPIILADEPPGGRSPVELWARIIASPYDEDDPPLIGDPATARGFWIQPGEGCETATVAFLRRADATGRRREWFWHCCCKTQYASIVSDEHLIMCHTNLVALLDFAISIGVDVIVRDETHYWETRDTARLVDEVREMNRLIARLAGKLADAMGTAHAVNAPIFDHPQFEHLESRKQDM